MPRPPEFLVLAMDIGSSSVRAALFDHTGSMITATLSQRRYSIRYTPDGGAELSPTVVRRAASGCVAETLQFQRESRALRAVPMRALSGCSLWHSLLGLDRRGQPVTPVFSWADARSQPDAAQLRLEFSERDIQLRTGCMLRASFWPTKLRWLRRTNPTCFKRVAHWVSPAVWISRELFGIGTTSHSMASGTGLYNLQSRSWDHELCDAVGVSADRLGAIEDVITATGTSCAYLRGAMIFSGIGDGAASNLGSGADRDHRIAINIGTSAAVRTIESQQSAASTELPFGLFRYVVDAKRTLLGGAVSNAGNLRQWALRELKLTDKAAAEKALARRSSTAGAITVLPFWVAERAPTWPEELHGLIAGLTQTTTAADVYRAMTASTYYRLADILDEIERALGTTAGDIIASGGVLHSPASVKLLANCLGRDIRISRQMESSLRGAAVLAIDQLGGTHASTPAGRLVRHQPEGAEGHLARRERQRALERLLAGTAP